MTNNRVLLTGSTGFVGSRLLTVLDSANVLCAVRKSINSENVIAIDDLTATTNWSPCFSNENGFDVIVHCAARVHVINDDAADPIAAFREVNAEATANFARQAAAAGVKRFIFLSTIKVNGEFSVNAAPFKIDDKPAPRDAYGISKFEAEVSLKEICAETGMEFVIIRPPLVYGPNVPAHFLSMLKWVYRGMPLPFGGIKENKRSLVFVDNLVDLIRVCIEHPAAGNQVFLVSDDEDISTSGLLVRVASALGVKSRLLSIPVSWLGFAGKLLGKKNIEKHLCSSLQVNIEHTKETLGWRPPYSMEEGLRQTAKWYKEHT